MSFPFGHVTRSAMRSRDLVALINLNIRLYWVERKHCLFQVSSSLTGPKKAWA